jgi:negative elongation factor B
MSTVKMPGTGLEDVGVPGQSFLRDALTSCTDPLKAIEEFQVLSRDDVHEWGI